MVARARASGAERSGDGDVTRGCVVYCYTRRGRETRTAGRGRPGCAIFQYLLATPEAFGSLWVCFMCSINASPPRKSLWHTGQLVAFGPPIRAACCWNTTRCCNSFFGGPEEEVPEAGTRGAPVESRPREYHHRVANQKRRTGRPQNRTIYQ